MNIIFTGMVTNNKEHFGSLLDGEHIKYDKNRKFVNLYAAFDIYYINNKSVRELNFVATEETDQANKFRLYLLNNFIKELKPKSVLDKDPSRVVKRTATITAQTYSLLYKICKEQFLEVMYDCSVLREQFLKLAEARFDRMQHFDPCSSGEWPNFVPYTDLEDKRANNLRACWVKDRPYAHACLASGEDQEGV